MKQANNSSQPNNKGRSHSLMIPRSSFNQQHRVIKDSIVSRSYDQQQAPQMGIAQQAYFAAEKQRNPLVPLLNYDSNSSLTARHSFDSKLDAMSGGLPKIGSKTDRNISKDSSYYISNSSNSSVSSGSIADCGSVVDEKDAMRLRIRELEKEVSRLSNHMQQAEQSIKNYRGCLSDRTPRLNSKKDTGAQTDADETANLQQALTTTQAKLTSLTNEFISMKSAKDEVFKERSKQQELNRKKEDALQQTISRQERTIKAQEVQIREMEQRLTNNTKKEEEEEDALKQAEVGSGEALRSKLIRSRWTAGQLRREVDSMKIEIPKLLDGTCTTLMQEISNFMHDLAATNITDRNTAAEKQQQQEQLQKQNEDNLARIKNLKLEVQAKQSEIMTLQKSASAAAQEIAQLLAQREVMQEVHAEAVNAAETATIAAATAAARAAATAAAATTAANSVSVNVTHSIGTCTSPVRATEGASTTATTTVTAEPLQPVLSVSVGTDIMTPEKSRKSIRVNRSCSPIPALCNSSSDSNNNSNNHNNNSSSNNMELLKVRSQVQKEQSEIIERFARQSKIEKQRADEYQQQLHTASAALGGLQEVHQAELKAAKHLAHVKDLTRVGKEREGVIEKDRMLIEIKHLREIQNVLQFSIKTAEQSLEEVLPHVVVKLSQGRTKRLRMIDTEFRSRLKDVEQRSADTCSISSLYLDDFQRKAEDNSKSAAEMSRIAAEKMLNILGGAVAAAQTTSNSTATANNGIANGDIAALTAKSKGI